LLSARAKDALEELRRGLKLAKLEEKGRDEDEGLDEGFCG